MNSHGPVLLRLRRRLPARRTRPWARPAKERKKLLYVRRADHPAPPSTCASRRPPTGPWPRTSTHRTRPSAAWPWSSPAPARSGRWPSRARWAATRKAGETYLNYVVPAEYGDADGFQAGSTFKAFVLAAALEQGIPLSTRSPSPSHVSHPRSQFDDCDGKPYASSDTWDPDNSTGSGTFDLYTGTQESVNTFFAQLELTTGHLRAVPAGPEDGHRPRPTPRRRAGARRSPSASPTSARWRWPRPTPPSPPAACTAPSRPVTSIEDADGKLVKEYQPKCKQVHRRPSSADAVNDVLRGVQEPGGFGARARPEPHRAVGRQDRHHQQQHGRVVRRLHPEAGHRRR